MSPATSPGAAPPGRPLRLAVLQRVLPEYRLGLFRELAAAPGWRVRVFIGEDLPGSKVRSAAGFGGLDVARLPTRFFSAGGRVLVDHRGLAAALAEFDPDAVLCEGESNLLSYLKAARHRARRPRPALLHWSLGGVPGAAPAGLRRAAKRLLLSLFDGFVAYSSHGKEELVRLGCPADRVHVAVNVSDTVGHIAAARRLGLARGEARRELGLPEQFTVLYAGALEADKRLDSLLEALAPPGPPCNLAVLGEGPLRGALAEAAARLGLAHAFFPGRVPWEALAKYYRAADVFVLPGRGGMVISEAMAHGLPVVVHQADGTESDLVLDGATGLRLGGGDPAAIRAAVERLRAAPAEAAAMGAAGQALVEGRHTQAGAAAAIRAAVEQAVERRQGRREGACA